MIVITFIRSALFFAVYYVLVMLMALMAFLMRIFGKNAALMAAHITGSCIPICLRVLAGVRFKVEGEIPKGPAILAAKHQSSLETFLLHGLIYRCCYVFKEELLKIPILGWGLIATDNIAIKREEGVRAISLMLANSERVLAQDKRVLVIFPEGTRRRPGAAPAYHSGVALFYKKFPGIPVYPLALNSGVFLRKGGFLIHPGTMIFRFLPAMPSGLGKDGFMAKLQETIENNLPH